MDIIWIFVLGGAVLLWIGFPLWRGRIGAKEEAGTTALQDLLFQKENLLAAARDLDLDLETDKLSPEDYRLLRERCQTEAVAVMERLEALALAQSPLAPAATEAKQTAIPTFDGEVRFCPQCGRKTQPPYQFCTACGLSLSWSQEEEA
jgi:hypothetical protein